MKKILILLAIVGLAGCEAGNRDLTSDFSSKPEWLSDCKIARLDGQQYGSLYVMRCPNSTTSTTPSGKHPPTTVVIDGVEYTKK